MKRIALLCALLLTASASAEDAFRAGPGIQITKSASLPGTLSGRVTYWADSAGNARFGSGGFLSAVSATTKGDLSVFTGTAWARLAVGANDLCLVADSTQTTGMRWATCAAATGYQTVQDEGTPRTQRTKINFIGSGVSCVDNSGTVTTDCTFSGGGGGETLAATYSLGVSQLSTRFDLDATRLGLIFRDASTPITGPMVSGVSHGSPDVTYFSLGAGQTQDFKSGMADGGSAVALRIDTGTTWSNSGARLLSVLNANADKFVVYAGGDLNTAADGLWFDFANQRLNVGVPSINVGRLSIQGTNGSQSQMMIANSTGPVRLLIGAADSPAGAFVGSLTNHSLFLRNQNNNMVEMDGVGLFSESDHGMELGNDTHRWKQVLADTHGGVVEVVGFSPTPTFAATGGEIKQFTLTANVTSWTLGTGKPAQIMTLEFIQDSTGGFTLSGTPANVLFAGGSITLTVTANKRDTVTLRYDSNASKWVEIGRALNL